MTVRTYLHLLNSIKAEPIPNKTFKFAGSRFLFGFASNYTQFVTDTSHVNTLDYFHQDQLLTKFNKKLSQKLRWKAQ